MIKPVATFFSSTIDLEQLRYYPPGSFGRAWADVLDQHGLEPFTVGPRRLQLHDGVHALLGYGVDFIDEARVQAFLLGTENRTKPLNIAVLALLYRKIEKQLQKAQLDHQKSRRIILKALWQAYQRGRNSKFNPDTWEPEKLWHLPLQEVRAKFQV